MRKFEIIKEPVITERSMDLIETNNSYTFIVDRRANKVEIKKAVEDIFGVTVLSVNTINVRPKKKRMGRYEGYKKAYKKAIVKLVEGETIDAFMI